MSMRPAFRSETASARTLLLAALGLAAVVMVVSVAILSTSDSHDASSAGGSGGEGDGRPHGLFPSSGGGVKGAGRDPAKPGASSEDDDDTGPEFDPKHPKHGGLTPMERVPSDGEDEWVVNEDSLRAVLEARNWEEIRRQMEVLQADGKAVPPDVVKALMAMLAKEDTRLDAVLALGGVKDEATGRALAELVSSETAPMAERLAALDVLAHGGQAAALAAVTRLATDAAAGDDVLRHAVGALAGIGGPEATQTLLDLTKKHAGDGLDDVILNALGKSHDVDVPLSQAMRKAIAEGDKETIRTAVLVAQMQGAKAGAEMKTQLESIVSGGSLSAMQSEEEQLQVRGMAMPAAVAMGVVEPVLRAATTTGGPLRDVALQALRQARGDDAAKQIAAALARTSDETERRELTVALGETLSKAATPTLVALLDDSSVNVRNAAARGLGQIRDPAAVKPILAHVAKAGGDRDFALGLVDSLGKIGVNSALPALEKLAGSDEEFWKDLRPFIQNAMTRIQTGNPDSQLLGTARNPQPK